MFKGFLSRRISYFLMILFIILNSILIYFDIFYLLALPLVILLGYLFVFRLDLIFLTIVFCTPLSFNFENLDLLGIGFYFPTEPLLLVFTLMFLFKALYEKNLKKEIHKADLIYHLAGITNVGTTKDDIDKDRDNKINLVGVTGTRNIIKNSPDTVKIIFPSTHVVFEGLDKSIKNIKESDILLDIFSQAFKVKYKLACSM